MTEECPQVKSFYSVHPAPPSKKTPWGYGYEFQAKEYFSQSGMSKDLLTHVWSPITWKLCNCEEKQCAGLRNHRLKVNFIQASFYVLDFDHGVPMAEMVSWATGHGLWHIIGPSPSHRKDKGDGKGPQDRFRAVFLPEQPITDCDQYEYNIKLLAKSLNADPKPTNGATLFYNCQEIASMSEGGTLGVNTVPADYITNAMASAQWNQVLVDHAEDGTLPSSVRARLLQTHREGGRDEAAFKLCKDLLKLKWSDEQVVAALMSNKGLRTLGEKHIKEKVRSAKNSIRAEINAAKG